MTEVNITTAPATEDPKHVEAMIAKAEGRELPATEDTPERPEWLPEGFNTPEELAAAYAEATKTKTEETQAQTEDASTAAANAAGLNISELEAKVVSGEGLSADDYEALAKVGFSKELVDRHIEGQRALGEALTQRIYAHVGGQQALDAMVTWAGNGGMTKEEAVAFNKVIDSGTEADVKLALDGLKAKYNAAGQNAPKLLGGGRNPTSTDVYASVPQMMEDMRDPRYTKDPAFRAAVEAKVARSSIL